MFTKKIADIINKYKTNIFFFTYNYYSNMRKIVFEQNNNTCWTWVLSLSPFNYYTSLCRGAENGGENLNNYRGLKRKKWPNIKKGWMIHKHEFMMACFHRITRCATLAYSFVFLCAFRMSAHINQRFVTPAVEMQ